MSNFPWKRLAGLMFLIIPIQGEFPQPFPFYSMIFIGAFYVLDSLDREKK